MNGHEPVTINGIEYPMDPKEFLIALKGTKFYGWRQNNSGGRFDYMDDLGIGVAIIIEAECESAACERLVEIIESRGYQQRTNGECIECCGSRWDEWNADHTDDSLVAVMAKRAWWRSEGSVFLHRYDGTIEKIEAKK